MNGFRLVLFLILLCPPRNTSEGFGDEFNSRREGDGQIGRQVRRERGVDEVKDPQGREMGCREEEKRLEVEHQKKGQSYEQEF